MPLSRQFIDALAVEAYGMSLTEAYEKKICVSCKLPAKDVIRDEGDLREYSMSGLCGKCFEESAKEIEQDDQ